jgi:hypothetical protein
MSSNPLTLSIRKMFISIEPKSMYRNSKNGFLVSLLELHIATMSGYEVGNATRAAAQEMDRHFQDVLYTTWFQRDLATFLQSLPSSPRNVKPDITDLRLWTGSIGSYYCRPGQHKQYITLIVRYGAHLLAYEQDSLDDCGGIFRVFDV